MATLYWARETFAVRLLDSTIANELHVAKLQVFYAVIAVVRVVNVDAPEESLL